MPRGTGAAARFQRDLQKEFNAEILGGYEELRADMAIQFAEVAERSIPKRTGKMARTIAASVGSERKGAKGGSAQVRRVVTAERAKNKALAQVRINFATIYVMVNDFKASLLELGTVKMSPRPFWRAAVESVRNLRR